MTDLTNAQIWARFKGGNERRRAKRALNRRVRQPGTSPSALYRRRKKINPDSPLGRLLGIKCSPR